MSSRRPHTVGACLLFSSMAVRSEGDPAAPERPRARAVGERAPTSGAMYLSAPVMPVIARGSPYLGRGGDHPPPSPPREIRPRGQEVAREEPRFSQVISSISTTRAFAAERSEEEIYGRGMKAYQDCVVRTARL